MPKSKDKPAQPKPLGTIARLNTDPELWNTILAEVSAGGTLSQSLEDHKLNLSEVYKWLKNPANKAKADDYNQAREYQAEAWADKIIKATDVNVTSNEQVQLLRLKIDTLKWVMARTHGTKWGEKLAPAVNLQSTGPVTISWGDAKPAQPTPALPESPAPESIDV